MADHALHQPTGVKTIERSIHIHAPRAAVYEFVTEPTNLPEVWTALVEVSNSSRKPDGWQRFDFVYKMAGVQFHGRAETTEAVADERVTLEAKTGITCAFRWVFEGEDDSTTVHLLVQYEVPSPLLTKVGEWFVTELNEREVDLLLACLKDRVESMRAEREHQLAAPH